MFAATTKKRHHSRQQLPKKEGAAKQLDTSRKRYRHMPPFLSRFLKY